MNKDKDKNRVTLGVKMTKDYRDRFKEFCGDIPMTRKIRRLIDNWMKDEEDKRGKQNG